MRSNLLIGLGGVGLIAAAVVATGMSTTPMQQGTLPAGAAEAVARLKASPRHGEWVMVKSGSDSVKAWLVYPERRTSAPVVVVIHEIYGLSNWVRGVADQLAADGFIAIAPDLQTMQNVPQTAEGEPDRAAASAAIRTLDMSMAQRMARASADYAMALPSAVKKYGIVGYCWGGTFVWNHAIAYPDLGAAVTYYGSTPSPETYASIKAPVLGLYGSNDARVNNTIPRADSAMKALNKKYEHKTYEGAGHGFLRAQEQAPNLEATKQAWPATVAWFRTNLR